MALIPLNVFKTKTANLQTNTGTASTVYTAPVGTTAIVLMAQIANLSTGTHDVSFIHHRNRQVLADAQGNGAQQGNFDTFLVKNFGIPASDAFNPITGKLIIEELDSIRCYATTSTGIQITLSILESANQ
jgi:hypothetical protein